MAVDFRVFESKKYAFFIEDELVRVCLERKGNEMYYSFEIDRTADTPRNRARKMVERRYSRQFLTALACFIGLVLFAALVLPKFSEKTALTQAEILLLKQGVETTGRIMNFDHLHDKLLKYQFISGNNQVITGSLDVAQLPVLSPMPIIGGDEFVVIYVPSKPHIHTIYLNRPTDKQIIRFEQRAVEKHMRLHPSEDERRVQCFVRSAYALTNLDGLADIFYQDTSPALNPEHNSESYTQLVQSLPFMKKIENDCNDRR